MIRGMAAKARLATLALVASLGACAHRARTAQPPAPAQVGAPAAAPLPPPGALIRCDAARAVAYADWYAWLKPLLDAHGAVDGEKARELGYQKTPEIERMLRRGLEACDPLAPQAIVATYRKGLEPDLTALLGPNSVWAATPADAETAKLLRVAVLRALNVLAFLIHRAPLDHSDVLVPLLSDDSERVRSAAVSIARQIPMAKANAALLDRVQYGADDHARREAATALLAIWDIYPRPLEDHADLVEALRAPPAPVVVGPSGDGFWTAALILQGLETARRSSGSCSRQVQPARIHTRLQRMSDRVIALGIDEIEESCGNEFVYLIFLEAPFGVGHDMPARLISDSDPAQIELPGPKGPIPILYERKVGVVRVAGVDVAHGDERVALVAVDGPDVKVTLHREYALNAGRNGDVIADVWKKLAPLLSSAPPPVNQTPWPAVLPCAHPAQLGLHMSTDDDVTWSSRDGKTSLIFPRSAASHAVALERSFPVGALDHIVSRGFPPVPGPYEDRWLLELTCRGDATISWGPCADGRCAPAARYPAHRAPPKSSRTRIWTAHTRYPQQDEVPEIHYSRFKQRIGYRKVGDPEIPRQSIRLAHDLAADLIDMLHAACPKGRCSKTVVDLEPVLAAFIRDESPSYTLLEHLKWYDHWNSGWYWTLTSGGRVFKAGCSDITESLEVYCSLELDVVDNLRLHFGAKNGNLSTDPDVALYDREDHAYKTPLGTISYLEDDLHESWVDVAGRALAIREGADR
jgi:hypothetical protein